MLFIILCAFVALVLGLILYARWNYGTLEKLGIPVDKPHFLLGNTYYTYHTPGGLLDIDNFKRLGPVYGVSYRKIAYLFSNECNDLYTNNSSLQVYEGRVPQVHVCDAELVRLITTKDSDYFNAKRQLDFRDLVLNEMGEFQPRGFLL